MVSTWNNGKKRGDKCLPKNDYDIRKNAEGYSDPTAYEALKNLDKEDEEFHKLLHTIFYICELSGFQIQGRIILVNKKTGKVWR